MTKRAVIFPGQGSQFIGMGKEIYDTFPVAREVFEEVDDTLGQNLSKVIFDGPEEDLTLTSNTQPALMAVSIAMVRVIQKEGNKSLHEYADLVAGHSLGEYSALAASGALSLADAAKLLRIRGNAMQKAVPVGEGGMAALIGIEFEQAQEIAKKVSSNGACQAANDNGGGQVVLSGAVKAIDAIDSIASEFGVKKVVKLPVSAPFHSSLMQPAADAMKEALDNVMVQAPSVPVVANVTADVVKDPQEIKDLLVKQVTGTVRWRETVIKFGELNTEEVVEIGAGKVLTGLGRRIDRGLKGISIQTVADLEGFIESL